MAQRLGRGAAWLAATVVSATAAWAALQPVLDTAVPDRLDVPSGDELRAAAGDRTPTATPTSSDGASARVTPTSGPPPTPPPTSPPTPPPTSPPASPPASPPTSTTPPTTDPVSPPGTPPTTITPGDDPVEADDWTEVTLSDGSTAYVQSIAVEGGTAVIQVAPGRASLVSATPNEPYSVETEQSPGEPERLIVDFYTAGRLFVIDAMWWEGRPYAQVSDVD